MLTKQSKLILRLILVLTLIPFLVNVVKATSSTFIQMTQPVSNAGTFAVQASIAAAQTLATVTTVGAVTAITNALPAGTNLLGKMGIDQTTPGTTNKVSIGTDGTVAINAAIPAGTNLIGKMGIDQTAPGTTNAVVASIAAAQTIAVTNTGTFAVQTSGIVSIPTVAKVGATTTSAQLIAANATRKAIEIDCDCANTDSVAINWGAGAAVYASHKQIPPCGNWNPPAGIAVQTAIQIISNTGTQNCRVIEYP